MKFEKAADIYYEIKRNYNPDGYIRVAKEISFTNGNPTIVKVKFHKTQ